MKKNLFVAIVFIIFFFSFYITNFGYQIKANAQNNNVLSVPVLKVGIDTAADSIASFRASGRISGFCSDFTSKLEDTLDIQKNPKNPLNNPYEIKLVELTNKYLEKPNLRTTDYNSFHRYDALKIEDEENTSGEKINVDLICGANTNLRQLFIDEAYTKRSSLQWINNWEHVEFSDYFHLSKIKLLLKKDSELHKSLLASTPENIKKILKSKGINILASLETTTNYQLQKQGYEDFLDFTDINGNIDYNFKSRKYVLDILERNCNSNLDCKYVYASDTLILKTLLNQGYENLGYTIYPDNKELFGTVEEKYAIAFNKVNKRLTNDKKNRDIKTVVNQALALMSDEKLKLESLEQQKFVSRGELEENLDELNKEKQLLERDKEDLEKQLEDKKPNNIILGLLKLIILIFLLFSAVSLYFILRDSTLRNEFFKAYISVIIALSSGIVGFILSLLNSSIIGK